MGQFIPAGHGEATLNLEFLSGPSNPMAVVFGYEVTGSTTAQDNADELYSEWGAFVSTPALFSNNLLLSSVSVLENPGGVSAIATGTSAGTNTAEALPPQVAALIRKVSNLGGRGGRGRMYWPGIHIDGVVEGGFLEPGNFAVMQSAVSSTVGAMGAFGIPMVILHETAIAGPPATVVAVVVQLILATQRRRIRG